MQTIAQCYHGQPENNILTTIMNIITSTFASDIRKRETIEYQTPSPMDKILVEQHMIPTFIYEEAQGDAFIRSIDEYERSNEKRLPIFQEIINNLFEAVNVTYEKRKIIVITTMRIFSILIQEAFLRKDKKEKASYWGEQVKNYKKLLRIKILEYLTGKNLQSSQSKHIKQIRQ